MGAIDIGLAAIDRATFTSIDSWTQVDKNNPANDTGAIKQVEIWLNAADSNDVWFGTFSAVGDVLTCRDSESVGNVPAGSKQTFSGLDIDVVTGDYLGTHAKTAMARIELHISGYDGRWGIQAEVIDPTDSMTFSFFDGDGMSLYGTGATPPLPTPVADGDLIGIGIIRKN